MLPHQRLPTGFRRVQRALSRRRRCAAAHLSDTASPCHLPSRGGFGARRLRGKAPLEGSWREATERCCRTNGFPQSFGLCNRRSRAAAPAGGTPLRHGSAVPPPLKGRLWGASPETKAPLEGSWREAPERCYRTEGFPQSFGLRNRRSRAAALRAAHLSVTLRVPPLLKERLWGASPEREGSP